MIFQLKLHSEHLIVITGGSYWNVKRINIFFTVYGKSPRVEIAVKLYCPLVFIWYSINNVSAFFHLLTVDGHISEKFYFGTFISAEPPVGSIFYNISENFTAVFRRSAVNDSRDRLT